MTSLESQIMPQSPSHITIVGGGYLGTMAALLFSQRKDVTVTLIEKQNKLGGLYSSAWSSGDFHFDFGSRAILTSGVPELDALLFKILPDDEYPKTTDNLKEFSFQHGARREYSNCLDARFLPQEIFQRGRSEMMAIDPFEIDHANFANQKELALALYGPTLTEHLITPAIEKLCGLPIDQLDSAALEIHGLQRIIVDDREAAKQLKADAPFNDARIAYAKYNDNATTLIKTYPKTAPLSDFGARIQGYLKSLPNVRLILESSVAEIMRDGNTLSNLKLETGETIECGQLLWTIPSIFLARLLEIDTSDIKPPIFRNTVLAHFLFKGDLKTDAYFVYNYDPEFVSYRATFYENFSERPAGYNSATIEIFHDALEPDLPALQEKAFQELITSNCISVDSKLIEAKMQFHRGSWPNFAVDFFPNQMKAGAQIVGNLANVHLLGKANGKHHSGAVVKSANELYQKMFCASVET